MSTSAAGSSRPESRKASKKEALRRGGEEWRFMTETLPTPPSSSQSARNLHSSGSIGLGGPTTAGGSRRLPSPIKQNLFNTESDMLKEKDASTPLFPSSTMGVSLSGSMTLVERLADTLSGAGASNSQLLLSPSTSVVIPSPPAPTSTAPRGTGGANGPRGTSRGGTPRRNPRQHTRPLSRQPKCTSLPESRESTSQQFQRLRDIAAATHPPALSTAALLSEFSGAEPLDTTTTTEGLDDDEFNVPLVPTIGDDDPAPTATEAVSDQTPLSRRKSVKFEGDPKPAPQPTPERTTAVVSVTTPEISVTAGSKHRLKSNAPPALSLTSIRQGVPPVSDGGFTPKMMQPTHPSYSSSSSPTPRSSQFSLLGDPRKRSCMVPPASPRVEEGLHTPAAFDTHTARRRRSETSRRIAAVTESQMQDTDHPFGRFASLVEGIKEEFGYADAEELRQLERLVSDLKHTDLCRRYAQFHPLPAREDNVVKPVPSGLITPSWQQEVQQMKDRLDAIRRAPNTAMHEPAEGTGKAESGSQLMVLGDGETVLQVGSSLSTPTGSVLGHPTAASATPTTSRHHRSLSMSHSHMSMSTSAVMGGRPQRKDSLAAVGVASPRVVAATAPFGVLRRKSTLNLRPELDTDSDSDDDHQDGGVLSSPLGQGSSVASPGGSSAPGSINELRLDASGTAGSFALPSVRLKGGGVAPVITPPAVTMPKVSRSENPFHVRFLRLDRIDMSERQERLQAITDDSVAHLRAIGLLK